MEKFDPTPRGPLVQIENHNTSVTVGGDAAMERIKELCAKHGIDPDTLLAASPAEMAEMRTKLIEAKPAEPGAEPRP